MDFFDMKSNCTKQFLNKVHKCDWHSLLIHAIKIGQRQITNKVGSKHNKRKIFSDFAEVLCKGLSYLICEFNSKASKFILKQTYFILYDLTCTSSHYSWIFTSYMHSYSHPSHFPPTPIPKSQSKETFRASSIDIEASAAADWQGKAIQQDKMPRHSQAINHWFFN